MLLTTLTWRSAYTSGAILTDALKSLMPLLWALHMQSHATGMQWLFHPWDELICHIKVHQVTQHSVPRERLHVPGDQHEPKPLEIPISDPFVSDSRLIPQEKLWCYARSYATSKCQHFSHEVFISLLLKLLPTYLIHSWHWLTCC